MSENTFSRVEKTENRLYGPRKLLVCGYAAAEQEALRAIIAELRIENLPLVFATTGHMASAIKDILSLPGETGKGEESKMRRAVIMSGISEKELHLIMGGYRSMGRPAQLWATVTPVSEGWPLKNLLEELAAERDAMMRRQVRMQAETP